MKWPEVELGSVCEIYRGGSPRPIERFITNDPNGLSWIKIGDTTDASIYITKTKEKIDPTGASKSRQVFPGDLLLTNSMSFGRPYISAIDGYIHDGWLLIRDVDENLDKVFLCYFLGSARTYSEFSRMAVGGVVNNLNSKMVRRLKVPLPPLAEQKRIARILDQADVLRAKRRDTIKQLDALVQSVFLDMFGDPVTNPKGWETPALGTFSTSRLGKMLDAAQQTGKETFPYLANFNVQWGRFELGHLRSMDFDEKDRKEFELKSGDLLICEGGEIGRTAIWQETVSNIFFQKALHRVRLDLSIAVPEYLLFVMWFLAKNGGFKDHSSSATIPHLTGAKLKRLPIPTPPIDQQRKFAEFYRIANSHRDRASLGENELERLFLSIQSRAFKGEL